MPLYGLHVASPPVLEAGRIDKWSFTFSVISELLEAIVLWYMHLH